MFDMPVYMGKHIKVVHMQKIQNTLACSQETIPNTRPDAEI